MNINIGDIQSTGNVSVGNKEIINNYYKSSEWQDLQREKEKIVERLSKARINVEKYPQDNDFKDDEIRCKEELEEQNRKIEQFKYEVMQLAEKFTHIKIDTERRKKVYRAFLDGRYSDARAILEAEESIQENEDLLERRESLKKQQEKNEKQLRYKAEENILLAHLYMIDYSLGNERVPRVEKYFQLAIEQHNNPSYRLEYALFLSINNKFIEAENIYEETLNILRENRGSYEKIFLIRCLKYFADFLKNYPNKWDRAEEYYRQIIDIYECEDVIDPSEEDAKLFILSLKGLADILDYCARYQESEVFYQKCLDEITERAIDDPVLKAIVFHDFSIMLAKNPLRFMDSEKLHLEALKIRHELVTQNPEDVEYLEYLVRSLKSLAKLLLNVPNRHEEARKYYQKSINILTELTKIEPDVHSLLAAEVFTHFAILLNNIWDISGSDSDANQAEYYYKEAIYLYKNLNLDAKKRELALNLHNWGTLKFSLGENGEANKLYIESLVMLENLFKEVVDKNNIDIQDDIAMVMTSLADLYSSNNFLDPFRATYFYEKALGIRIGLVDKQPEIYLTSLRYCLSHIEKFINNPNRESDRSVARYEEAIALINNF